MGLRPNQVSIASVGFAVLAGASLVFAPRLGLSWRIVLFLAAASFIQLRLLCNLLDGMLAVEGGLKTKSGEVFNDLPDRLADSIILVAAGYSATSVSWAREVAWAAALLAVLTAYVRVLGGATGVSQHFQGPMAKQHRMALMTAACVVSAGVTAFGWSGQVMAAALGTVVAGCLVTVVRRVRRIVAELESK
jgi:phosphatidylglycerophosphate synthase